MRYLVEPRDWIFVKRYGFLSSAKKIEKYASDKCSAVLHLTKVAQKVLDSAKCT